MDHARQQSIVTVNTGSSSLKAALYPLNGTGTLEIGARPGAPAGLDTVQANFHRLARKLGRFR